MIATITTWIVLSSLSLPADATAPGRDSVLIRGVPHVLQKPDFCGEACLAMYLGKLGAPLDQDDVFEASGVDPAEGRGCHTRDLVRAMRRLGFRIESASVKVDARRAGTELEAQWRALHRDLRRGRPSIVCMRYDGRPRTTEHFRLVLGYDREGDEVIYHEPAMAEGAHRRMPRKEFLSLWPLKYEESRWTVIRLPLQAEVVPEERSRESKGLRLADFAQHVFRLRRDAPEDFTIVVEPPFVVIGDETKATVRARSRATVRWAVDRLKDLYFDKDPDRILDIWLFRDERSYRRNTRKLFEREPTTPFGFVSPEHDALIMNIATGGGTLVHEIVHPFIEANFPSCPAWFNEGLASLYEQCRDADGRIHGLTNWRLAGLQRAIRQGRLPSFQDLTSTTTNEFYHQDPGTNYAQARYLCYYLQEKDLLVKFYRLFRRNHSRDPSGYSTLEAVLGVEDMTAFRKEWERFVLGLSFP